MDTGEWGEGMNFPTKWQEFEPTGTLRGIFLGDFGCGGFRRVALFSRGTEKFALIANVVYISVYKITQT